MWTCLLVYVRIGFELFNAVFFEVFALKKLMLDIWCYSRLVLDNATFHPKVSHLQDQRWSHEESLKFWILHPKLSDGQSAQKGIMDF